MKRYNLLIPAVVTALLCGCASSPAPVEVVEEVEEVEEAVVVFDIANYKSTALELCEAIYNEATFCSNCANYEVSVLKNLQKLSGMSKTLSQKNIDSIFENVAKEQSKEAVEANHEEIKKLYKDFILTETDGSKEASEIEGLVRSLYENDSLIYETVFTPGGSATSIANTVVDAAKDLISDYDTLKLFCEE